MDSAYWRELRGLFEEALDLEGSARAAFVRARTADRSELRSELERLLAAEAETADFLGDSAPHALGAALEEALPEPGAQLGAYRIVRLLGRGGMGSVYEARQERPQRSVALKVLQAALSTPESRRRFEAEAEILARLRHAAIAQVHQSGVHRTASGVELPWFAMEFVEQARDLVTFARERELDVAARLALFGELCSAVQHAHNKGVIHRDLKPGNVLVDAAGRVKVIDFGVARLVDGASDAARQTRIGYVLGTLQYMSPEQLSGGAEEVDARSDLYALGVLLYELLAGQPPYDVEHSSVTELVARICERDPPAPSQLAAGLSRELDWVVLRALAKQPRERYASVAELAADLERFRRGEALVAGPATRRYRVRKFVTRHRVPVGAALLLLVALLAGITSTGLALRQVQAARRAEARQLQRQSALIDTLRELAGGVLPEEDGRQVTMFSLLERHRGALLDGGGLEPALRAALLEFYAEAYFGLGQLGEASQLAEAALEANDRSGEPDQDLAYRVRHMLLNLRLAQNRNDEVEPLVAAVEAHAASRGTAQSAEDALRDLRARAMLLGGRGEFAAAIEQYRGLVQRARAELPADNPLRAILLGELAELLNQAERLEEAQPLAVEGFELAVAQHGEDSAWAATLAMRLGPIESRLGHLERALELQELAVDVFTRELGPAHSNTLVSVEGLARVLLLLGDRAEAERLLREALETCRTELGDDGLLNEMRLVHELANVLAVGQQGAQRLELLRTALERLDALGQGESYIAGQLRVDLAR